MWTLVGAHLDETVSLLVNEYNFALAVVFWEASYIFSFVLLDFTCNVVLALIVLFGLISAKGTLK